MERRPLANERFRFHKLPKFRLERECGADTGEGSGEPTGPEEIQRLRYARQLLEECAAALGPGVFCEILSTEQVAPPPPTPGPDADLPGARCSAQAKSNESSSDRN